MRNEAFLRLFAGSGRRELGDGLELRVVPAYEVLQSRREAMDACGEDEQTMYPYLSPFHLQNIL